MRKIRAAQVISHGRPGTLGIDILCTDSAKGISKVNCPKVDTIAHKFASIRDRGVKSRRGKLKCAADFADEPHLGIKFKHFFGAGLHSRVGLNVLDRILAAFQIPFVIIVATGIVLDAAVEIVRMECHAIF